VGNAVKSLLWVVIKTMKVLFIVFLLLATFLLFLDIRVPSRIVRHFFDKITNDRYVVSCESVTVGLRHGLGCSEFRVYDRASRDSLVPLVSARKIGIDPFARTVRIAGLKIPRLPETGDALAASGDRTPAWPTPGVFRLELESPEILGIAAQRLTAQASLEQDGVALDEIHVEWPDRDHRMTVSGRVFFDPLRERLDADVQGLAMVRHIRPLIAELDLPVVLSYMDAFTDITDPVPVRATFAFDARHERFEMSLSLRPTLGRYRGIPMTSAEGVIAFSTSTKEDDEDFSFRLDLPAAIDTKGRLLGGRLEVAHANGETLLTYDVKSALEARDILVITECLSPETVDMLVCATPPELTMKGRSCIAGGDLGRNALDFTMRLARGSLFGFQMNGATADFSLARDVLTFRNVRATGKTGGDIRGEARLSIPDFEPDRATVDVSIDYRDGSLEELADLFSIDLKDRHGRVDGSLVLSGPATTNFAARLNGAGKVAVKEGRLIQLPLFAGLTELLAARVPGVGYLVNQSTASADFTISNGVVRTDNLFIEGGVLSIKGWGGYDIGADRLDCTVRVQFLKEETLLGKLVHPVTWPFTKLLLEFRGSGPIASPVWEYVSVIDRIL
jgi:hypothetical protein